MPMNISPNQFQSPQQFVQPDQNRRDVLSLIPPISFNKVQESNMLKAVNPYVKEYSISSADTSNEEAFCENILLKGKISFNEAIGLIHFCRIGFQLLKEVADKPLSGTIKHIIVKTL